MKPLSCPNQFILWQQRAVKNNFQEKELSHNCSTSGTCKIFFVAAAATATVYQEPHSGELRRPGTLASQCDQKFSTFESIA